MAMPSDMRFARFPPFSQNPKRGETGLPFFESSLKTGQTGQLETKSRAYSCPILDKPTKPGNRAAGLVRRRMRLRATVKSLLCNLCTALSSRCVASTAIGGKFWWLRRSSTRSGRRGDVSAWSTPAKVSISSSCQDGNKTAERRVGVAHERRWRRPRSDQTASRQMERGRPR
jgi:hypothetical protein